MSDDKDKYKPQAPSAEDILKTLRTRAPFSYKSGEIPKPTIMGSIPPKTMPGAPNFGKEDVLNLLKEIDVPVKGVYTAPTGSTYIKYGVPGNPLKNGEEPPTIRLSSPKDLHAGKPQVLTPGSTSNFIDTSGADKKYAKVPSEYKDKFIKSEGGDYYNNLEALRNAVLWRTGKGLVPPGSEPSKIPTPPQSLVKLPPDPNQLDFMGGLLENYGTQRPQSVVGGNPNNLFSSNQMSQRFNLDTPKSILSTGKYPDMPQPANREPPMLPGIAPSQQGTFDQQYRELLKLLAQSKELDK